MPNSKNTRQLAHIDCPGGGQVWVEGTTLYIGHMRQPSGTTIVDVADPARPRVLSRIEIPPGWHSHKVRVANDIMIVNHERLGDDATPEFGGGLGIYDVAKPAEPKLIGKWRTHGKGVHRYDFDGRYAYISPTAEGYVGNIMMILDLADPAKPRGGRALVDPRPVARRRRGVSVGEVGGAALPSPPAPRRPPLCQLLAPRLLHPRHRRHGPAEGHRRRQHLAGVPAPDPHLPAHAGAAEGPPHHGRRRRGRRQDLAGRARLHLDLRHHRRDAPDRDRHLPGRGTGRRWFAAAGHDGLPPAVRALQGYRHPFCLVREGPAHPRHRRSLPPARDRLLRAGPAGRLRPGLLERRHHGFARPALSH